MQVFFQWSVVCKNAGQMKIRLITLEGKGSEREKDKNIGQWLREGIGREKNWMVASGSQVWVLVLST